MTISVYAAQTVTDRIVINDDTLPELTADDLFGYQIEAIGDLDGDGVIDLAEISFEYDDVYVQDVGDSDDSASYGLLKILFMNNDGTVKSTNDITMDDGANGLGTSCLDDPTRGGVGDDILGRDDRILEQLAFVGDLDGDGRPTIAIGVSEADFQGDDSRTGGIYMVELNSNGDVNNCLRISEGENGFNPDPDFYLEGPGSTIGNISQQLSWPLIATDLNGDGQNELIAGATNEADTNTDLWVLFLNANGSVSSHSAEPISSTDDLGLAGFNYINDGATIDGEKKIILGLEANAVQIVNLTSDGEYSSSTTISGVTQVGSVAGDSFGAGVTGIGDIDGNTVDDVLVGAVFTDADDAGKAYILYLEDDDSVLESQEISNDTEFERTGSTFLTDDDFFGHGMTVWKSGGGETVLAIGAIEDDTGHAGAGAIYLFTIEVTSPRSSGGGDNDLSRPTFGLDHHTFVQRVDEGLLINGTPFTVDNNYFTHIPMQNMTVGQVQNFTATVYAPHQLYVMEFLFGIPEVGKWNDAEASLALYFDYTGKLIEVEPKNADDTIADFDVLKYSYGKTLCVPDDNTAFCDRVSIEFVFNEAPLGNVLALQAIDLTRRSTVLYFNDGLDIQGDSLNPPVLKEILSPLKGKGTQTVERIDKANDIWKTLDEDEPIELYQQNSVGTFIPMERKTFERFTDGDVSVMTRLHSGFGGIMSDERDRASQIFDSSQIQSTIGDSYIHNFPLKTERILKLYELIEYEKLRAAETINLKYTHDELN